MCCARSRGLAAKRRTEDDLTAIDAALAAMSRDISGGGRGVVGDERFHAAVTAAAHSGLLARLMAEISELIRESPGVPASRRRKVADAICEGDASGAAAAMAAHIEAVSDVALLRDERPDTSRASLFSVTSRPPHATSAVNA